MTNLWVEAASRAKTTKQKREIEQLIDSYWMMFRNRRGVGNTSEAAHYRAMAKSLERGLKLV